MRLFAVLGWISAVVAAVAAFALLRELVETRAAQRLETVRLPGWPATVLPDDWASSRYRVLLVGDSRIRRWEALPSVPGIAFGKSAIGGETTGQLQDRFERDVLNVSPPPDEIILASGINDLVAASVQKRGARAIQDIVSETLLDRLRSMTAEAKAKGIDVRIATIVQPTTPDIARRLLFWDDSLYTLVSRANAQIPSLDAEVIDFNAILEGGDGPMPERFSTDTLHFNATAYDTLNATLNAEYANR